MYNTHAKTGDTIIRPDKSIGDITVITDENNNNNKTYFNDGAELILRRIHFS